MVRTINSVYMPMNSSRMIARPTRGAKMIGKGAFLLDGGLGGQASYSSIDDYVATTGRAVRGGGLGLGFSPPPKHLANKDVMNKKIESLMVKPKTKNIKFNL
jgi:hypothetical protein